MKKYMLFFFQMNNFPTTFFVEVSIDFVDWNIKTYFYQWKKFIDSESFCQELKTIGGRKMHQIGPESVEKCKT